MNVLFSCYAEGVLNLKQMRIPSPEAEKLYEESFPPAERRSPAHHRIIAAAEDAFHPMELSNASGEFVGILYYWHWPQHALLFVEHLAIMPSLRGRGFGHEALQLLQQDGICIILEIEPVADAATARRLAFYESAGFVPLPFEHEQLPYHIGDSPIPLTLLSRQADGTPASAEMVNLLEHLLRTCVMRLPHAV